MSKKIFVGNLSFDTNPEELAQVFSEAGQVVEVFLPEDRATGRPRGFAFVEFTDASSAELAIELFDGQDFAGRNMRINLADERPQNRPGGGPPPGGGGPGRRGKRPPGRPKGSRRGVRGRKRRL